MLSERDRLVARSAVRIPGTLTRCAPAISFVGTSNKGSTEASPAAAPEHRRPLPLATPPRGTKRGIGETRPRTICGAQAIPKRLAMPKHAASPVSLIGLDPLDEMDITDPNSCSPAFYSIRLGQNGDAVPVTFIDRRAETVWAGIFSAKVFDQLIIKCTQPQVPSGICRNACQATLHASDRPKRRREQLTRKSPSPITTQMTDTKRDARQHNTTTTTTTTTHATGQKTKVQALTRGEHCSCLQLQRLLRTNAKRGSTVLNQLKPWI